MPDIAAEAGIAALVEADTGVSVVVDIAAEAGIVALVEVDTAAFVETGTADFDTVEAGIAALVVPIAYPSSSQFLLPSNHQSTHLRPCQTHNLPWGIMESHVFACIPHPKTVL